jgi:hypothetical protein
LAFSCRERAGKAFQKPNDLARAAVGCNAVFGIRHPSFAYHPHAPTTPSNYHALHDGRSIGITHIWYHAWHNQFRSEPRPSGISLPRTSNQHNEPS